jgi:hypothetical protein
LQRLLVLLGLLAGGGSLVGCHRGTAAKAGEAAPSADAVKRDLEGVKGQLGDLTARFTDLRKQVEAVPPNLPGFQEVRAKFYATEEGRGVMDAKVTILAGQLDAALSSGKGAELLKVSKDIAETRNELGKIDQIHVALLHQVMGLQRMAAREKEASAKP